MGRNLTEGWLALSLELYVLTGLFWLPVVCTQIRLRDLARQAVQASAPLPPEYFRLFAIWFACGIPAFFAVLGILWLKLARPDLATRGWAMLWCVRGKGDRGAAPSWPCGHFTPGIF